MFLLLLSDGLSSAPLISSLPDLRGARAAVIPNAIASTKARDAALPETEKELRTLGAEEVALLDLARLRPKAVAGYDLYYYMGGNAFLLLKTIRERGLEDALRQAAQNSVTIGSSGGALALGGTVAHIELLDKSMNRKYGLTDFRALGLTQSSICPHRERFRLRYPDFERRMRDFQAQTGEKLFLLRDGEGLLCTDRGETFLRGGEKEKEE